MDKILIIGGGVAGLGLANRLSDTLGRQGKAKVTLIDHSPMHIWKPMLHEFAAGTAEPSDQGVPFPVQARRKGFRFVPGTLTKIDAVSQSVEISLPGHTNQTAAQGTFEFDRLVLSIGSRANDFGTPGAEQHCLLVDDLKSAMELNEVLRTEIVQRLATEEKIQIAIVGAGATGVQLSAEIRKLVAIGSTYGFERLEQQLEVTLIEGNSRILKAFDEVSAERVASQLQALGIRIECDRRVAEVDETGIVFQDGSRINASLKVWAAGVAAPPALKTLTTAQFTRWGQLAVGQCLRVKGAQRIFAMGDCCSLTPEGEDHPLPASGQVAAQQASFLAKALKADLRGEPLPQFRYEERGGIVSLGGYGGFGALPRKGFVPEILIHGRWARMIHPLLFRAHMFEILGLRLGSVAWLRDKLTSLLSPGIRF